MKLRGLRTYRWGKQCQPRLEIGQRYEGGFFQAQGTELNAPLCQTSVLLRPYRPPRHMPRALKLNVVARRSLRSVCTYNCRSCEKVVGPQPRFG